MAIVREIPEYTAPYEVMLNLYPNQFVSEGGVAPSLPDGNTMVPPRQHVNRLTKENPGWWKINMDYFYTVALAQYNFIQNKVNRNYELLKGIIRPEDFYEDEQVLSFVDKLIEDVELPKYVKHYPILNPVINGMVGEATKRPDTARPKAMDDESKSEMLNYLSGVLVGLITDRIRNQAKNQLLAQGTDVSNLDEFNKKVEEITAEKLSKEKSSYTSTAEKWANHILKSCKVEFNTKELFEEGFRDLLTVNFEGYHIHENKSKTGFTLDCLNRKYTWWLTTPDKKYTRDAYAAGTIEIMELSQILDEFDLPLEEIEHLRDYAEMAFFPYSRRTNLFERETGIDSIKYNAYDPLVVEERNKMEAMVNADAQQTLDSFLGNAAPNVGTFGNRFVVTTAYWKSKRKVGLLSYKDKDGVIQSTLVDDFYKDGDHPQQISLEWGWVNQWYKGLKIGDDIYHVEPLEILDYCPIIGVSHEIKNTPSVSLVDLGKPLQSMYNVCLNQVWRLLEKEKGKIFIFNKRFIPLLKDGDYKDSVEIWERGMEERGICFIDDSPDNLKTPSSFNQFTALDLNLNQQIQSRLELALAIKRELWELCGLTPQRLGQTTTSESATGVNTAVSQSYAQTESYFVQHEYLCNQVLQAIIDVAKYIECKKPESSICYIDSEGENQFINLQTESDLSNRDIKLFVTNRQEDQEIFKDMRNMSQNMLQNGVHPYIVAKMRITNSVREMLDTMKEDMEKKDQQMQQAQQTEQQKVEAQEKKDQAETQQAAKEHDDDIQVKTYEIDTKANTQLTIEKMKLQMEFAKNTGSQEPDLLAIAKQNMDQQKVIYDRDMAQLKLELEKKKLANADNKDQMDMSMKQRKLDLEERNINSREKIEKEKLKIAKQKSSQSKSK